MPSAQMIFDVIARDGASGSFRRMAAEADGAGRSFDRLGKAAAGVTVLFAAFAVNAAAKFESAMTRISTQAGVPIGQIKALGDSLLKLAPQVGTGPEALATSLYHVESAFRTTGISAGKAIDIVKQASELAKIGNADIGTTTQAIIGVLASGIKGVKDATDAAAQLNQLVGTGDTTLQKVADSIATGILPTAATLGLSFKDVAAGIATLTDNVTPADTAARNFKTSLLTLIKPSHQQAVAFQEIGLSSLQLGQDFRQPNGLLVGVRDLKDHLDATFPAGQKTALTIAQLDGAQKSYYQNLVSHGTNVKDATKSSLAFRDSITGISAATLRANTVARELGGSKTAGTFLTFIQEIDRLTSKYKDSGTAAQAAAKFQEAWANQQQTFKQKLDDLKASWDVFLIKAGNAILPTLKKITDFLSKHPAVLGEAAKAVGVLAGAWALFKIGQITTGLYGMAKAILTVGAASSTAAGESAAGGIAGGAASRGLSPAAKVIIPVAVTYAAASALGLRKQLNDVLSGQFKDFGKDSPKWEQELGAGIRTALTGKLSGTFLASPVSDSLLKGAQKDIVKVNGVVDQAATAFKLAGGAAQGFWGTFYNGQQITKFQDSLKNAGQLLDSNTNSLIGNTKGAESNRAGLKELVNQAVGAAQAYANTTGKQSDYTKALQLAIPQIEDAAAKTGLNRGQVDQLIRSLGILPPNKAVPISTPGVPEAQAQIAAFLQALAQIPSQVSVPVTAFLSNPGAIATELAGSAQGLSVTGKANGGISYSGVRGGIVQWAEAGGESFIPHDPAKRQRALDIWTKTGRVLGVTGMADGGISAGGLTAASTAAQTANYLKALATATNNLVGKLTTYVTNQQQYRNTVQGQLANGNTFNDILGQSGNAGDIKTLLRSKLSALKAFVGKIATLKKTGWPDAIIRDIASDGVDVGSQYADLLLHASKSDKASITGLSSELTGGQLAGANLTAALTGGTAGLTNRSALAAIESAAFTPGANIGKLVAQAARTQVVYNVMPVANQHINSPVDLKTQLGAATFLIQSGGTF